MKAKLVIHPDTFIFNDSTELEERLSRLIEIKRHAREKGDKFVFSGLEYYPDRAFGILFDSIKDYSWQIQQYVTELVNYCSYPNEEIINADDLEMLYGDENCAFFGVDDRHECAKPLKKVWDSDSWYEFHWEGICLFPPNEEGFSDSLRDYFENLYFNSSSVDSFLSTLEYGLTNVIRTVVHHLKSINKEFLQLYVDNQNLAAGQICSMLQQRMDDNPVAFGCSKDSNGVEELNIEIKDIDGKNGKVLYCDLHTKMWEYIDGQRVQKPSDRIYFNEPIKDFIPNKIIIARVGRHRKFN